MQVLRNIVLSPYPPYAKDCIWAKPIDGGFVLYILFNGEWQPMKTEVAASEPTDATGEDTTEPVEPADNTEGAEGTENNENTDPAENTDNPGDVEGGEDTSNAGDGDTPSPGE